MTDERQRIRVDIADLTLGELCEVGELLGTELSVAMTGPTQPRAIAAIVAVMRRRDQPDFTLDDALAMRMQDIELVAAPDPEASAGNTGDAPPPLPASGD